MTRSICSATRIITEIAKLLTARRSASPVRRTAPQCGVSAQNRSSWANSVVAAAETSREDYGKNCSRSLLHVLRTARAGTYLLYESSERRRNESSFDFSGKILVPLCISSSCCYRQHIRAFCDRFYIPF